MRALVISDTHFGAWTGEDLLREPENLMLLAPHLEVDEVIDGEQPQPRLRRLREHLKAMRRAPRTHTA